MLEKGADWIGSTVGGADESGAAEPGGGQAAQEVPWTIAHAHSLSWRGSSTASPSRWSPRTATTTVLGSRPMLLERLEPDGSLTFLTHLSSDKVQQVARDPRVNVAFVSDRGDRYVSVSGTVTVTHDPARMQTLWKPTYRAWFPGGADDPDSAIFSVRIEVIDSWDVPTSRLVRVWCAVKAARHRSGGRGRRPSHPRSALSGTRRADHVGRRASGWIVRAPS